MSDMLSNSILDNADPSLKDKHVKVKSYSHEFQNCFYKYKKSKLLPRQEPVKSQELVYESRLYKLYKNRENMISSVKEFNDELYQALLLKNIDNIKIGVSKIVEKNDIRDYLEHANFESRMEYLNKHLFLSTEERNELEMLRNKEKEMKEQDLKRYKDKRVSLLYDSESDHEKDRESKEKENVDIKLLNSKRQSINEMSTYFKKIKDIDKELRRPSYFKLNFHKKNTNSKPNEAEQQKEEVDFFNGTNNTLETYKSCKTNSKQNLNSSHQRLIDTVSKDQHSRNNILSNQTENFKQLDQAVSELNQESEISIKKKPMIRSSILEDLQLKYDASRRSFRSSKILNQLKKINMSSMPKMEANDLINYDNASPRKKIMNSKEQIKKEKSDFVKIVKLAKVKKTVVDRLVQIVEVNEGGSNASIPIRGRKIIQEPIESSNPFFLSQIKSINQSLVNQYLIILLNRKISTSSNLSNRI